MRRGSGVRRALFGVGIAAAGALAWIAWRRERAARCVPASPLASVWSRVDGMQVHARTSTAPVAAELTPVVLVHGLGMSSRYMLPLARCLGPHVRVLAPDLPGFGLSEKPERFLTVAEQARALAAWMDAAGLSRAVFVGNSLGCEILVELALRRPERVAALVLQGPTPDPEALHPAHQIPLFFVTGLFERPSLAWVALSDYLGSGVRRYLATFRDMLGNRIEHKLPYVEAPALVVWGSRDFLVPRASAQRVAALLPRGALRVVEGAAHGMNYSHPRALARCIMDVMPGAPERPALTIRLP